MCGKTVILKTSWSVLRARETMRHTGLAKQISRFTELGGEMFRCLCGETFSLAQQ